MKTIRRLIYGEILLAVGFVLLAFLSLFLFFDFVDELTSIGKPSVLDANRIYGVQQALLFVTLLVPSRIYELMPIAVLIGCVFVMARLAQSSEYTILRTSGLGPGRALRTLLLLGAGFVALTFAMGDYLAPLADRSGQLLKAQYEGRISVGQRGAWLKERGNGLQRSVNVGALTPEGEMENIRIYEFDAEGQLLRNVRAATAEFQPSAGGWLLGNVQVQRYNMDTEPPQVTQETLTTLAWDSTISAEMVSVALLSPERMRTVDLFNYINHLQENNQTTQRYEIEFWRKVFYPLSCLVMVVLALPFAYLHFRSGGVAGYVFLGVMVGISFFLLNNLFGYVGNLRAWDPVLAAAAPAMLYSLASLGAFGWLVLRR